LRPSLERVEGQDPSLHGFVISQEPASGAEIPADSQVFIYVAVPARAIVGRAPEDSPSNEVQEEPRRLDESCFEERADEEVLEDNYLDDLNGVEEDLPDEGPAVGEVRDYPPPLEDATDEVDQELLAEAETREEPVERVRVWDGPAPGAVPRRRLSFTSPDRRWSRSLPLGVWIAVIGLFVCSALTLLVGLASQLHSGSGPHSTVAAKSRSGTQATPAPSPVRAPASTSSRSARAAIQLRGASHAPSRPAARRVGAPSTRVVTVVTPPAPRRVSPVRAGAPLTGTAAEEHAIREFGP
jgi:hypothetical protein